MWHILDAKVLSVAKSAHLEIECDERAVLDGVQQAGPFVFNIAACQLDNGQVADVTHCFFFSFFGDKISKQI